jgi:hypothetical protein
MAAGLFTSTGRHVGFLSLLAEDPSRPGPADRSVVAALTTVIADALDRTWEIAETARIVAGATAGVLLTRSGATLPLPGQPDHRLLVPRSPVLVTAADELAVAGPHVSFLAPTDGPDGVRLVRVTALDCAAPALDHISAAVLLSAPGDLRGLDLLQLSALGLLVEGVSRLPAVAAALGVEEHTAADALGAVLVAMRAADLTAATVGAVRAGLRIPPRLAGPDLGRRCSG